ncbi:hypothetical protein BUN20_13975 [Bacteroides fragilis]|nr:hypothetical protein BUN20_13975 [Bacteroides fragilis]
MVLIFFINLKKTKRMKQEFENGTQDVHMEQYETPRMEVIEMEIEGPILQMSGEHGGRQDW